MIAFNKDEIFTISLALKELKLTCEEQKVYSDSEELTEALQLRINDCNNAYVKILKEYQSLEGKKN